MNGAQPPEERESLINEIDTILEDLKKDQEGYVREMKLKTKPLEEINEKEPIKELEIEKEEDINEIEPIRELEIEQDDINEIEQEEVEIENPKEEYIEFLQHLQEEPKNDPPEDREAEIEQSLESKENQQILETLFEHPYEPFPEKVENNELNILMIKGPNNPEKALDNLRHHRPIQEFLKEGDEETPSCSYHYNQINSWESIQEPLHDTIERNRELPDIEVIKIKTSFSVLMEYHSKTPDHGDL
jgi:hypothetical protein